MRYLKPAGALLLSACLIPLIAYPSSHREAPQIAGMPRVDGTDSTCSVVTNPDEAGM